MKKLSTLILIFFFTLSITAQTIKIEPSDGFKKLLVNNNFEIKLIIEDTLLINSLKKEIEKKSAKFELKEIHGTDKIELDIYQTGSNTFIITSLNKLVSKPGKYQLNIYINNARREQFELYFGLKDQFINPTSNSTVIIEEPNQKFKIEGTNVAFIKKISAVDTNKTTIFEILDNTKESNDEIVIKLKTEEKGKLKLEFYLDTLSNTTDTNGFYIQCKPSEETITFNEQYKSNTVDINPKDIYYNELKNKELNLTFYDTYNKSLTISSQQLEFYEPNIIPSKTKKIKIKNVLAEPLLKDDEYTITFSDNKGLSLTATLPIKPQPVIQNCYIENQLDFKLNPYNCDNSRLIIKGISMEKLNFSIYQNPLDKPVKLIADEYVKTPGERHFFIQASFDSIKDDSIPKFQYNIPYRIDASIDNQLYERLDGFVFEKLRYIFDDIASLIKFDMGDTLEDGTTVVERDNCKIILDGSKLKTRDKPQYLKLKATLYNDQGLIIESKELKSNDRKIIKLGKNESDSTSGRKEVSFNLSGSDGFANSIKPGRHVVVEVSHAAEAYPDNIENTMSETIECNIRGKWYDYFALTFTLPPFMYGGGWKTIRDTIHLDNGDIKVNEKYKFQDQPLLFNVGFGITIQPRIKWYKKHPLSAAVYIMGLNIINNSNSENTNENYFIDGTQLAIMATAQLNITNLETNTKTPVMAGIGWAPGIDGRKIFFSIGLGIDFNFILPKNK